MSNTYATCMNFFNALDKIPGIIAQYEIPAELAPKQEKQDFGEEVKQDKPAQHTNRADVPYQSIDSKIYGGRAKFTIHIALSIVSDC